MQREFDFITYARKAKYSSGRNSTSAVRAITLHTAECNCRFSAGAIRLTDYAATMSDGRRASWNFSVSNTEIAQSLPSNEIAWHAGSSRGNRTGPGIEMATAMNTADWTDRYHQAMIAQLAKLVAGICLKYNIPPVRLTANDLKAGKKGIVDHNIQRLAFGGTSHRDVGKNFPWSQFLQMVKTRMNGNVPSTTPVPTNVVLEKGSTGTAVKAIQRLLGVVEDGDFGPTTEAAVKGFQRAQSLERDGIVGPITTERIKDPKPVDQIKSSFLWYVLHSDATPPLVFKPAYNALVNRWRGAFGIGNGSFDSRTTGFTQGFQYGIGVIPHGAVDRITWGTMFAANFND